MFNVGDEIEIVDGKYFVFPSGTRGKITSINSRMYNLDFGGTPQNLFVGDEHLVKLVQPVLAGDTVEYVGMDAQYAGLYGNVLSVGDSTAIVQFNVLTSRTVVNKKELKLVSRPIQPSQQSQTPQHTYGSSTLPYLTAYGGINVIVPNLLDEITYNNDFVLKNTEGCQHDYKVYTGLAKRYDYCTKCDHTKNERGIYD